jgi:small subunit ribosomal protein S1
MELVGTKIPVKILEVNRKRNRLIVSQRAAQDEDRARQREELFEKLQVGDLVSGKVSGLTSYGAFVNLGGADGLIHISELSWDRINNVSDMLTVGDEVSVKVIKLDPELSRISLSLRQMSADPWDTIEDRFPQGKPVEGIVTKTKKYGAFLQIADGVEGLLHISELSWDHVERTEDVLKVGDKVTVMVLNADKVRRRISLSLRQLQGRGAGSGDVGEEYYPGADYEPTQVRDVTGDLDLEDDDTDAEAAAPVETEAAAPVETEAAAPVETEASEAVETEGSAAVETEEAAAAVETEEAAAPAATEEAAAAVETEAAAPAATEKAAAAVETEAAAEPAAAEEEPEAPTAEPAAKKPAEKPVVEPTPAARVREEAE